MTPQQLKNAILQQAIQGKLVEQRAEEGIGQELYKVIQEEKQKLIEEGKLKKQKALPEITEDEIPFEIPESWKWVRLGEISTYSQTKMKINVAEIETPMWSLDLEDIEKESGKIIRRVMTNDRKISGEKIIFKKGQILYSKLRPYLKKILIAPDNGVCSSELVPFDMIGNCNSRFIIYVLKSAYVDFLINSVTYGVKMPRVGTDTMINLLIPLPPLAEQKRIVEIIEELLPLVERYEKAWARLEELNKKFPLDMQKAILGQAIQGKLVEQRAEEGTGQELFEAIQEEKQKLIEEDKLKKQKALPEITEEEIPFEIPETWKWVRLGDLAKVTGGYAFKSNEFTEQGVRVIRISDFNENGFVNSKIVRHTYDDTLQMFLIEKKNILLCMTGGTVGKSLFVKDVEEPMMTNQRVATIKPLFNLSSEYINYNILSFIVQKTIVDSKNSTNDNISMDTIKSFLIPLPPLAEQKRIVDKIEELLPLVEKLK